MFSDGSFCCKKVINLVYLFIYIALLEKTVMSSFSSAKFSYNGVGQADQFN